MAFVRVPGNPEPEGAEEIWFEGRGGLRIRALYAPAQGRAPRGSVIVCNGRTEFIEKYFELIGELQERGFCVFTIDWRGQGLSGRLLANRLKGHLVSIDDAVSDLAAGLRLVADKAPRPHILIAHSMGGAISLRALQTRRIEVDGAVFSAPMWGIAGLRPWQRRLAGFFTSIGMGGSFALGTPTRWKKEAFKGNPVTNDRARHERAQALVVAEPDLALAGPTWNWLDASCTAMEGFRHPGALAHLRAPMMIVSAGDELLVDNSSHALIAKLLPEGYGAHMVIEGAKHEITQETDERRAQFLAAFDAMATKVAPQTTSAARPT